MKKTFLFTVSIVLTAILLLTALPLAVSAEGEAPSWAEGTVKKTAPGGVCCYVSPDGSVSVPVSEENVTWLYYEWTETDPTGRSAEQAQWFGLQNPRSMDGTPILPVGARFSVKRIEPGSEEYEKTVRGYDTPVSLSGFDLFIISVTREDGTGMTAPGDLVMLFVTSLDDVNWGTLGDESLACIRKRTATPEGEETVSVFLLDHFGEPMFMMHDSSSSGSGLLGGGKTNSSDASHTQTCPADTTDTALLVAVIVEGVAIAVLAAFLVAILLKSRRGAGNRQA